MDDTEIDPIFPELEIPVELAVGQKPSPTILQVPVEAIVPVAAKKRDTEGLIDSCHKRRNKDKKTKKPHFPHKDLDYMCTKEAKQELKLYTAIFSNLNYQSVAKIHHRDNHHREIFWMLYFYIKFLSTHF